MDLDIKFLIFLLSLKVQAEKKYSEDEYDDKVAYIFENMESLKEYMLENGLDYLDSDLYLDYILESCVFRKSKSGKVLALKRVCDSAIYDSKF